MRDFATLLTRVTSLRRFRPLGVSSTRPGSALPYAVVWSLDRVSETLESLDLSSSDWPFSSRRNSELSRPFYHTQTPLEWTLADVVASEAHLTICLLSISKT